MKKTIFWAFVLAAVACRAGEDGVASGTLVSTGQYERVECVAGMETSGVAWRSRADWHLEISGVFRAPNGEGSVVLRMPVLDEGQSLALVWDGAGNGLQFLAGGLPRDFEAGEGSPVEPKTLVWRVLVYKPTATVSRVRLETEGVARVEMDVALPGLETWLTEGEGVATVGVANAELAGFEVRARKHGTLLLVR